MPPQSYLLSLFPNCNFSFTPYKIANGIGGKRTVYRLVYYSVSAIGKLDQSQFKNRFPAKRIS